MKLSIAVDANVIISALLGGKARFLLFDPRYDFLTTAFNIDEVKRYFPRIAAKSGVEHSRLDELLSFLPITIMDRREYQQHMGQATKMMDEIDRHDIDLLALALEKNSYLWSEDRHFEKIKDKIRLLKTEDLL